MNRPCLWGARGRHPVLEEKVPEEECGGGPGVPGASHLPCEYQPAQRQRDVGGGHSGQGQSDG